MHMLRVELLSNLTLWKKYEEFLPLVYGNIFGKNAWIIFDDIRNAFEKQNLNIPGGMQRTITVLLQ